MHLYTKENQEKINEFITYYKEKRVLRTINNYSHDHNQNSYLVNIIEITEELDRMLKEYNELLSNEMKISNTTSKVKKSNKVSKVLLDIISGLDNSINNKEEYNKRLKEAYKELEYGNTDDYIDSNGYIDDDVIDKGYPIEQDDEDDYE